MPLDTQPPAAAFELPEATRELRETALAFAAERLAPQALDWDQRRHFPVEEMREAGVYLVVTPEELVERCRSGEVQLVTSHPGCGGLPAEPSWEHVRLLCERVMPALA